MAIALSHSRASLPVQQADRSQQVAPRLRWSTIPEPLILAGDIDDRYSVLSSNIGV